MPAFDTHFNFAIGTVLSAPADATGQDFTLMPGDGQAFAANMPVTMCPRDVKPNGSNSEIGYITAVDGDALTILRAQERSLPMQVAANWQIFGSVTAKTVTDIEEAVAGKAAVHALEALDQVVATKADKTELFSGDYVDLRNAPTLGSAAGTEASDYATAAQGSKADTAVQPGTLTKADVELGSVDNTSDLNKPVSNPAQAALDNKADLVDGKVPESQLPSFVDDVLSFDTQALFPAAGEDGKIYIAKDTNLTYRWTGSGYAEISPSLALGETASTAYRGDRGKESYDHTLRTDNPHGTTKAQVGLPNVDNTSDANKPVSTAQAAALALKADFPTANESIPARGMSGAQASIPYSYDAIQNSIARRTTGGQIYVGTPLTVNSAITKLYADTADALKVDKATPGVSSAYTVSSAGVQGTVRYSESVINASIPLRDATGGLISNKFILGSSSGAALSSGTGFPNGVVSAPVGSTYTDTNATNGAIEWKKATGTGNTGWVVSVGDTGWRNITALAPVGNVVSGSFSIRRVGNIVTIKNDGLALVATNSVLIASASLIGIEFMPDDNYSSISRLNGATIAYSFLAQPASPTNAISRAGDGNAAYLTAFWNTNRAWPITLP